MAPVPVSTPAASTGSAINIFLIILAVLLILCIVAGTYYVGTSLYNTRFSSTQASRDNIRPFLIVTMMGDKQTSHYCWLKAQAHNVAQALRWTVCRRAKANQTEDMESKLSNQQTLPHTGTHSVSGTTSPTLSVSSSASLKNSSSVDLGLILSSKHNDLPIAHSSSESPAVDTLGETVCSSSHSIDITEALKLTPPWEEDSIEYEDGTEVIYIDQVKVVMPPDSETLIVQDRLEVPVRRLAKFFSVPHPIELQWHSIFLDATSYFGQTIFLAACPCDMNEPMPRPIVTRRSRSHPRFEKIFEVIRPRPRRQSVRPVSTLGWKVT